ncbi:hypothetical protein HF313_24315 [Massilia atriviolacea]|uniref:Uncharacterized protein n=1 Tax=Massilia atriviolacea TaxID=2495579 RepID=A0A430HK21_9BURK|nr:hypothetical protein [Massilia atriviolacea]RSZ57863.1 hypothetical protein EJB06_16170 [Massilia atriviolacea]
MSSTLQIRKWTAVLAVLGAAGGCGAPLYRPGPMAPGASALMDASGSSVKWICAQGQPHRLVGDADGQAQIPAGTRLTVGAYYKDRNGRCTPSTSFIPEAGQRYRLDLQLADEHCRASVLIDDPSAAIGARLAPGARPARACDL